MGIFLCSKMKAVAGLKMSYQVQQAINGPKVTVIRGFRHDDSDSALCSHLYTMVRGNRQHRRAFLISLLNLFDDSSVSSSLFFRLAFMQRYLKFLCSLFMCFLRVDQWSLDFHSSFFVCFYLFLENRGEHAAVHSRQLGLLPLPDPGGASFHHAPHRYYSFCLW